MKLTFIYNNGKTYTLNNVIDFDTLDRKGIATDIQVRVYEVARAVFSQRKPEPTESNGINYVTAIESEAFRSLSYTVNAEKSGLSVVVVESSPEFGDDSRRYEVIPFRGFKEGETPLKADELIDSIIWGQGFPMGLHARKDDTDSTAQAAESAADVAE